MTRKHRYNITEWNGKNFEALFFASTKFLGIGLMLDTDRILGSRKELWMFQIRILFIKFWWVQYKSGYKQKKP